MLAQRLKELRFEHKITQQEMASKLGISRSTLAGYESENKQPSYDILLKISNVFNISTDYLLGSSNNTLSDSNIESSSVIISDEDLLSSPEEKRLLKAYRALGDDSKIIALSKLLEMERAEKINTESEVQRTGTDNLSK